MMIFVMHSMSCAPDIFPCMTLRVAVHLSWRLVNLCGCKTQLPNAGSLELLNRRRKSRDLTWCSNPIVQCFDGITDTFAPQANDSDSLTWNQRTVVMFLTALCHSQNLQINLRRLHHQVLNRPTKAIWPSPIYQRLDPAPLLLDHGVLSTRQADSYKRLKVVYFLSISCRFTCIDSLLITVDFVDFVKQSIIT